ncbi:MAG: MFS transporter [Succinivibrio sp.]
MTSFSSSFMSSSLNIAVDAISLEFSVNPDLITYAISAYVISVTAFLLPSSALANRLGYRRTYTLGAFAAALAAIAVALSPSFWILVGARAVQGVVNSVIFATATAVLSDNTSRERRGAAIGLSVAAVYAGLTLSPSLGGVLTDTLGWRSMFLIAAALNLVAVAMSLRIRSDPPNTSYYPYFKMAVAATGLMIFFYSLERLDNGLYMLAPLACGIALIAWYFVFEQRSKHPFMRITMLWENPVLGCALGASLCNYMATFAIALLLSLHLQLLRGFSAMEAGLIMIIEPGLQCLVSPFSGKLATRVSPNAIVIAGMSLSTIGTLVFSRLSATSPMAVLFAGQALCGIGFGLFSAPNTTIVMNSVDRSRFALVSALQSMTRNAGMSLCMAVVSAVFALSLTAHARSSAYLQELQGSLGISFLISTILGVAGLCFCLMGFSASRKAAP